MTREIPLKNGGVVLLDDSDFECLSQWKWHLVNRYAGRSLATGLKRPKQRNLYMHVAIMGVHDGLEIDHIDRNPLNNTRQNLRLVTHSQNMRNSNVRGMSAYRGVVPVRTGGWVVTFCLGDGQTIHLGSYYNEIAAARVYDAYASTTNDPYVCLNFPNDTPLSLNEVQRIRAQQPLNWPSKSRATSRYFGVSYYKITHRWRAQIKCERLRHLGYFHSEVEAARAYDAAAVEYFGPFGCINFPNEVAI